MDETAIRRYVQQRRGWHLPTQRHGKTRAHHGQRVSGDNMKKCVTLVALISSQEALQHLLPQVLLVNTTGEKRKWNAPEAQSLQGDTLTFWTESTQWMTSATMQRYLHHLRHQLNKAGTGKVVLLLDACRAHLAEDVWDTFEACNVKPVVVPSGMTRWLQPLDVYTFGSFKNTIARIGTRKLANLPANKELPFLDWLDAVVTSVHETFTARSWTFAFARVGCASRADELHTALRAWYDPAQQMPLCHPSKDVLRMLYGRSSDACHAALFPPEDFVRGVERAHPWRRPPHRLTSKRSLELP